MSNQARACRAVSLAIRRGELPALGDGKTICVDCGAVAACYDHRDYLRPLDVEPVCRSCNNKRGPAKNHNGPSIVKKVRAPDSVDFQQLVITLRERGWAQPRLARKFGCSAAMISNLKTGKCIEPRYPLGAALVKLEKETRK